MTLLIRRLVPTLLLILFTLHLTHIARLYSATWDEAHHLYDGYTIWTRHDLRLNPEVPPLVKLVAALPLLPQHLYVPPDQHRGDPTEAFAGGHDFVFSNGPARTLIPARYACMAFTLTLAVLIFFAARRLFGPAAALIALTLFTFDPTVLANGTLVTTDLASACTIFAAIWAFYCYLEKTSPQRLLLAGLLTGLAMVTKFTGILLAPMLLLIAAADALLIHSNHARVPHSSAASSRMSGIPRTWTRRFFEVATILLTAWLVIWAAYGFRDVPAPNGAELSPSLTTYINSMPNPADARHLTLVARLHLLPQPYLWGLANTKKTEFEYIAYFFGHIYRHGPWQYFPVAFLLKSTLPLLLLLAALPLLWGSFFSQARALEEVKDSILLKGTPSGVPLAAGKESAFSRWGTLLSASSTGPTVQNKPQTFKARILLCLLIPIAVYFAVITSSHFDIGARHLLPLYPFLYVLAAASAAALLTKGRASLIAVALLLTGHIATTLRAYPSYMAYGNEAWGGPSYVHRYLSDANTDWGQQLIAVKQYLDRNHITQCWFVYFADGAVLPSDYGIPCRRLPDATSLWWLNLPMDVPPVISGTVLISDSNLEGVISGDGSLNPYDQFRGLTPLASIQNGVNVYQGTFAIPLASALVQARASAQLDRTDPAAALATAQNAASLAPDSALVQLNLANLLAAHSQWPEALTHYQLADHLAHTIRPDMQLEDPGPRIAAGLATARQHQ